MRGQDGSPVIQQWRSPWFWVRIALGLAISLILLGSLLYIAGPSQVIERLSGTSIHVAILAILTGVLILALRSVVAGSLYHRTTQKSILKRFYGFYLFIGFWRAVLPGGFASGSVVVAYLFHRTLEIEFERVLGAFTATEIINSAISLVVVGSGAAVLAISSPQISVFVLAVLGLAILSVGVVGGIIFRYTIETNKQSVIRKLPVIVQYRRFAGDLTDFRLRVYRDALSSILSNRDALVFAIITTVLYLTIAIGLLSATVHVVGGSVSIFVVLVALPTSRLGGLIPMPGGLGGVDSALTGLLVILGTLSIETAIAATLLYRLSTFWTGSVLGILAGSVLLASHGTKQIGKR